MQQSKNATIKKEEDNSDDRKDNYEEDSV